MSWTVEPDKAAHRIWMYPDNSDIPFSLEPEEAFDLGDDLMLAATRLVPDEDWVTVEPPPWTEIVRLEASGGIIALTCDKHGVIEYEGYQLSISQAMEDARGHWQQQHSQEENDEQRSDGRPDEKVRSGHEAASPETDVHDPAA